LGEPMAFKDMINQLFGKRQAAETNTLTPIPSSAVVQMERFQAETGRLRVIQLCRKMYKTDPRVERMHRTLARDMVKGGFVVKTRHEAARKVALELQKRLGLNQKCEDTVRLTARDGDSFNEIAVSEEMNITSVTRKPTLVTYRNTDLADQFQNPAKAFYMVPMPISWQTEPPADAVWMAEWQIIHSRWNWDEENRYGTPMMAAATSAFKRVSEGEMDVAVRRKTRAPMRYHHVVEGSGADIEAYKEANRDAFNNPLSAVLDFFSNKSGSITAIEGDAHLGEINDIMHHLETMATASDVPLALIGYGNDMNRDILGEKKEEYAETLEQGREWLSDQFVKPLLERQWLLKGILPESVEYEVIWRPRIQITPVLIRDLADALLKLKLLNVSDTDINAILTYFLPGVEIDALLGAAGTGGDSERLAGMLKGLSI
jgi:hypothetical protein